MSTLYKRATPRQALVLRMVEGAVKNTLTAHPSYGTMPPERLARSIAKRAAGTLTAGWPDVLARPRVASDSPEGATVGPDGARSSEVATGTRGTAPHPSRRSPIRICLNTIGAATGEAFRSGNAERERALKDVLRLFAAYGIRT